jgi:hypothetical protein
VLITPTVVTTMGAGFTVVTTGACLGPDHVRDYGRRRSHVTVTLHNVKGENPPPDADVTESYRRHAPRRSRCLRAGASTNVAATGGGTVATTGNQQTTTPGDFILRGRQQAGPSVGRSTRPRGRARRLRLLD